MIATTLLFQPQNPSSHPCEVTRSEIRSETKVPFRALGEGDCPTRLSGWRKCEVMRSCTSDKETVPDWVLPSCCRTPDAPQHKARDKGTPYIIGCSYMLCILQLSRTHVHRTVDNTFANLAIISTLLRMSPSCHQPPALRATNCPSSQPHADRPDRLPLYSSSDLLASSLDCALFAPP